LTKRVLAGVPARRVGAGLLCARSGRRYREAGPERIEKIV
jgi:hypothetical protein